MNFKVLEAKKSRKNLACTLSKLSLLVIKLLHKHVIIEKQKYFAVKEKNMLSGYETKKEGFFISLCFLMNLILSLEITLPILTQLFNRVSLLSFW